MADDKTLVERLRYSNDALNTFGHDYSDLLLDAANRIEALEAEIVGHRDRNTKLNDHILTVDDELEKLEAENERLRAYIQTARKSLPPDPDLNAPWSPCIAILDEAAQPKEG